LLTCARAASAVPQLYTRLDALRRTESFEVVATILDGSSWVWVGSGFAPPAAVAFQGSLSLAPYLHVVPADLVCFKQLFTALGVREAFGATEYIDVLQIVYTEFNPQPLDAAPLALALWMVQQLADMTLPNTAKVLLLLRMVWFGLVCHPASALTKP
jgi:sacsin